MNAADRLAALREAATPGPWMYAGDVALVNAASALVALARAAEAVDACLVETPPLGDGVEWTQLIVALKAHRAALAELGRVLS